MLPACSRALGLAAQHVPEAVANTWQDIRNMEALGRIRDHPACGNPAVEKSPATVAAAIVAVAELGSVALLRAVIQDVDHVAAGQAKRDLLRQAANGALLAACEAGQQDVVEFLLGDLLADAPKANDGPLLVGLSTGDLDALRQLLGNPGIRPTPRMLLKAADGGHFAQVNWLIKNYAPLFTKEAIGEEQLHQLLLDGATHDQLDIVGWVLEVNPTIMRSRILIAQRQALEHHSLAVQDHLMLHMGKLDPYELELLASSATKAGNVEGLRRLLAGAPDGFLPYNVHLPFIPYDNAHREALHILLRRFRLHESILASLFVKQNHEVRRDFLHLVLGLGAYPGFPEECAYVAMSRGENDALETLLVEGPPLNPACQNDVIDAGYINQNVNGLALFLKHIKVDQAILDKFCRRAQDRNDQQLMAVLCGPDIKEPATD
jgi:hypothetical protein